MALRPRRSNFVTTKTSPLSSLSSNLPNPGRSDAGIEPDTVSETRFAIYLQWAFSEQGRAWNVTLVAGVAAAVANGAPQVDTDSDAAESGGELMQILREGNAEAAVGGIFAELLRGSPLDDTDQSRLVVAALRRSSPHLHDASEEELGDYLRSLSPESLKGEAYNVKGIYHELYYVDRYNATHHDGTCARLHEPTNYPGADVQICDERTGKVLHELQLKAVDTTEPIHMHQTHYPDIDVAATDEVARKLDDQHVGFSGFSNGVLQRDSHDRIDELRRDTGTAHAIDTAEIALAIASTAELVQMLRGERAFPAALLNTATKVATAAGATAVTAFLFS
jgi:hypothetical protein